MEDTDVRTHESLTLVNSPSLRRMLDINGIFGVSYPGLARTLTERIGKIRTHTRPPIIFAPPSLSLRNQGVMRQAGFDIQLSSDIDREMLEVIRAQKTGGISEIVFVSNKILRHTLEVLLGCARSGIAVYIVGTRTQDILSANNLLPEIDTALDTEPNIYFTDIAHWRINIIEDPDLEDFKGQRTSAVLPTGESCTLLLILEITVERGQKENAEAAIQKGVGDITRKLSVREQYWSIREVPPH